MKRCVYVRLVISTLAVPTSYWLRHLCLGLRQGRRQGRRQNNEVDPEVLSDLI